MSPGRQAAVFPTVCVVPGKQVGMEETRERLRCLCREAGTQGMGTHGTLRPLDPENRGIFPLG